MKVFLDMDGVLCKFASAALSVHGRSDYTVTSWNFYKTWSMTTPEFWKVIDYDPNFWSNIDPYEWMRDLIDLVSEFDSEYVILTSPHAHHHCYAGKCQWIQKHLGIRPDKRAVLTARKELLAQHPESVLIDDSNDNKAAFEQHGGNFILFPQAWNANASFKGKELEYVRHELMRYDRQFTEIGQ